MQQSANDDPGQAPVPGGSDATGEHGAAVSSDGGGDGVLVSETPMLTLRFAQGHHESVVSLSGELDLSSAPPLRELLASVLAEDPPPRIVLDLSDLDYLDSTGLSVFVTAHKRALASGIELTLANPNPSVTRLFQITALDKVFGIIGAAQPSGTLAPAESDPEVDTSPEP
jgi:anti-sigma B factor antagonist